MCRAVGRKTAAHETRGRACEGELALRRLEGTYLRWDVERRVRAEAEPRRHTEEILPVEEARHELREDGVATSSERLAERATERAAVARPRQVLGGDAGAAALDADGAVGIDVFLEQRRRSDDLEEARRGRERRRDDRR